MHEINSLSNSENKPKLPVHEWLAVFVILGFMMLLTILTTFNRRYEMPPQSESPHYISDPEIELYIEGAVQNPGPIKVKEGTLLSDVLHRAIPLEDADLKRLKMHSKVRRGQLIKVPKQIFYTIYVQGAIESPGPIQMSKGSKLVDLLSQIKFKENADLHPLQKKRLLKDREVISIGIAKNKKE